MTDELKYLGEVRPIKRALVMRSPEHDGIMMLVIETEDGVSQYYTMTETVAERLSQTISERENDQ